MSANPLTGEHPAPPSEAARRNSPVRLASQSKQLTDHQAATYTLAIIFGVWVPSSSG